MMQTRELTEKARGTRCLTYDDDEHQAAAETHAS